MKYRVSPRALERTIELISARYHAAQYSQLSALIARHRTLPSSPRQQQHNDEKKKNHREIKRINAKGISASLFQFARPSFNPLKNHRLTKFPNQSLDAVFPVNIVGNVERFGLFHLFFLFIYFNGEK